MRWRWRCGPAPKPGHDPTGVIHHCDAGSQYTAIRYAQPAADAGALASIGSVGDSYDNALAESVIGLYKTECVRHDGPWRGVDDLELATLSWVHWFNTQPAALQRSATSHRSSTNRPTTVTTSPRAAARRENPASTEPGAVHCSTSCLRSRSTSSTTCGLVADGERAGRRDRGVNAASPSAR